MAKSELLKFGNKVTDKSMYTSGKGSSAAGLTIGLVKMENGNHVAQAGVLPLCSGGFAFIDEFDKMSHDDRSALHEGMEQQTVSIAKAGFRMTLPAKTPILAAANPKYGKYDTTQTILDNIDIPIPLISRFDMIWLIRDTVDEKSDEEKAKFILDTFTGDVKMRTDIFDEQKLRSFVNHVRTIEPVMTDEVKVRLAEIYKNMRKASNNNNGIAIGTRQLEALVRLTSAHAKLLMKTETDISDVECVEGLFNSMFKEFGIDIKQGSFNQNVFYTSSKMTKQQLFDHVWGECKDHEGNVMYGNFVKKLTENDKFDEKSAKVYFDNMERQCIIKHVGGNKWKKV
jgi:replicative DNA helicase Mcm